jgi:D-sedoheptulose 7-phosphate isomerase
MGKAGMNDTHASAIGIYLRRSCAAIEAAIADAAFLATAAEICRRVAVTLRSGGRLLIAGNGGSAADAQHIAAEFLSRFARDRHPLPAIALTTDTSVLTAIGNDYGFDRVFERQIRALGRKDDVFLAISTSGRSPNVLAALAAAREGGLVTVGFTGSRAGPMRDLCDLLLCVPSEETALIQQVHIAAAHAICGLVETDLFPQEPGAGAAMAEPRAHTSKQP